MTYLLGCNSFFAIITSDHPVSHTCKAKYICLLVCAKLEKRLGMFLSKSTPGDANNRCLVDLLPRLSCLALFSLQGGRLGGEMAELNINSVIKISISAENSEEPFRKVTLNAAASHSPLRHGSLC